ncbi:MAG: glycoside hydrolase family 78 protein [Parabacteroides sp.]|nr:glycoside hydrolase family 78 protein [Parabacteroides sp.]MDY5621960.1 family 78 glycoside hydrolase catalytic domain [Bacteroidales bacterium]
MKRVYLLLVILSNFMYGNTLLAQEETGKCRPVDLRCEHLIRPLGIDRAEPRFSWHLEDERNGAKQLSYRIMLGTDSAALVRNKGVIWQEKKNSGQMLTTYKGKALKPFTRYYWSITVWDQNRQVSEQTISSFETGFLNTAQWKGCFISDGKDIESRETPYFRKEFILKKNVKSARAYIVAAGLYELSLNGSKVGDHFLDPAFTDYGKRLLYVTYDVTHLLHEGENAVGVILGNGWYNHQPVAEWNFHKAPWRNRPSFCLNIHVQYTDGTTDVITSDHSFKVAAGPITFNAIYVAENYDFRKEFQGWNTLTFDDSSWKQAVEVPSPCSNIVSQSMHPIRKTEFRKPVSLKKLSDTLYLYDFGQNWSGITEFRVQGLPGTKVKLHHGEQLDSRRKRLFDDNNTQFYQNVKEPLKYGVHPVDEIFATDVLWLNGKENTFSPRFNYKGFQYVEVSSDKPLELTKDNMTSYFIHTDVPASGSFECSDSLINRLWRATNYSYLSNLVGYPTDCPHREKNGWTGDAHLAIETGLYGFDGITFYEKWMADHRDNMYDNGRLRCIIPSGGWGGDIADWTCSVTIIPWTLYEFYGDITCLKDNYSTMKKHTDYWLEKFPDGLITDACLGDWIPYKSVANRELTASIYHYKNVDIVSRTAQLLGFKSDYEHYKSEAERIKDTINQKFLNRETGIYANGYQTELSMPLYWGIVPEDCIQKVAEQLTKRVHEDRDHLDVGIMGCKTILNALTETGNVEQAYRMVTQQDYPSWGNWLRQGGTTLFENWDYNGLAAGYSQNHIMYGEIGAWFYKALAGINVDPAQPGFKNILLKPHFVKDLDYVKASYKSPFGLIVSEWTRKQGKVEYKVVIPPGATATLYLDGKGEAKQLSSGTYKFNI